MVSTPLFRERHLSERHRGRARTPAPHTRRFTERLRIFRTAGPSRTSLPRTVLAPTRPGTGRTNRASPTGVRRVCCTDRCYLTSLAREDGIVPSPIRASSVTMWCVSLVVTSLLTVERIAKDFVVHPMTLQKCLQRAAVDHEAGPGQTLAVGAELREARQHSCRWLVDLTSDAGVVAAYRADALVDAHRGDPESGHRLRADEARDAGQAMADRTARRICRDNFCWGACATKRGRNGRKPGPAVDDDLCTVIDSTGRSRYEFTAGKTNQSWLAEITEHRTTTEGELYLSAVEDGFSNRDRWLLGRLRNDVRSGRQCVRKPCRDAG